MNKVYELWLDESGKFADEQELRSKNMKPSLVGGLLVEKSRVEAIPYDELLDEGRNHAMELTNDDKASYILPVLEKLQSEYHAKQVFFENAEYMDAETGRQLYLRVIAEGLLQLMLTLNAQSESVELQVLIAQRQDMDAPISNRRILSQEYLLEINRLIEDKKKYNRIYLHENSRLNFRIKPAHREQKLQLADFACNTRLTRDSHAFKEVRSRVEALHKEAYIFSLTEVSSENFIKQSLVAGYISEAIMELYTSKDRMDNQKQLGLIIGRMKNMDYRLVKTQMKQCVGDIVAYVAKEDDYEIAEAFLQRIEQELVPALAKEGQPYLRLQFAALIQLSDMYLREGDVISAQASLERCRQVQEIMGNSLEEVFSYYQLIEKEALLEINRFNYKKGALIMEKACENFCKIMHLVETDENLAPRFSNIKSEYYGDALCMQLYAMLFMQRRNPGLYEEMCNLSDLALCQYPNEPGELERHRQYRSHIELEQGNIEEAIRWLFWAKEYVAEEITVQTVVDFWELICNTEFEVSCRYYLMYYLLIMCEAAIRKHPIGTILYEGLQKQDRILYLAGIKVSSVNAEAQDIDFSSVQDTDTGIVYHPTEVVYWKYATYLALDKKEKEALLYYKKATSVCFFSEEYLTMYVTGLGIEAERIWCLLRLGKKEDAKAAGRELLRKVKSLAKKNLPSSVRGILREFATILEGKQADMDKYWKMARRITY